MSRASAPVRALAIVPARLGSQRLPRKMLLARTGKALVVHTAENLARAKSLAGVVVATDADEIAQAVERAGFRAVLTSPTHPSGSDRVFEALEKLGRTACDVVVNVQGDEPELDPSERERRDAVRAARFRRTGARAAGREGRARVERRRVVLLALVRALPRR
jgi:3-deoxy-manno-octulosonate cytidylyltransferase (CMP-KDO synthetase)